MSLNTNNHRLHGIDFARAILMTLGLTYHAGLIYGGDFGWRVTSNETAWYIGKFSELILLFRMEAFYLISGFFYLLIYVKKRDGFLSDRVVRVVVPMLFFGVLFNPLMNVLSDNKEIPWNINYFIEGHWLGHLWFLGNLIVYFLISSSICKYIEKVKLNDNTLIFLFLLVVPCISVLGIVITNYSYNGTILFIHFSKLLYYYPYFILGTICFVNKESFLSLLSIKNLLLSLLLISLLVFVKSTLSNLNFSFYIIKVINYMITGPTVLCVLTVLVNIGKKNNPMIRRFSDSSYSIYLLHQPLIICLYVLIFEHIDLGALTEYLLIIFIAFITSYFIHIKIINKNDYLLFLFNGVRKKKYI